MPRKKVEAKPVEPIVQTKPQGAALPDNFTGYLIGGAVDVQGAPLSAMYAGTDVSVYAKKIKGTTYQISINGVAFAVVDATQLTTIPASI